MSLFRACTLAWRFGEVLVATHLLSLFSAQYCSICLVLWPNFLSSPFFFSPPIALHLFTDLGQPVQSLHRCAWVVLAHEGSHAQFCAFGFALLVRDSVQRRGAGRSGWKYLCLPPPSALAPGSNSFPSNIFPSCCQTHPDRENESASLHRLPMLRSQTVSPTPKYSFCISERLSISSKH